MSQETTYEVYLVPGAQKDEAALESPVVAEHVDFYDSGVWVTHVGGRDFFPYWRIRRISEGEAATAEADDEPAGRDGEFATGTDEEDESGRESSAPEET